MRTRRGAGSGAFNTSKVRLEAEQSVESIEVVGFQYLEGAIGSPRKIMDLPRLDNFQYLEGAIGRAPVARERRRGVLSIPRRCDWKWAHFERACEAVSFQYLEGAIGSVSPALAEELFDCFQYLEGAIGSTMMTTRYDDYKIFQYLEGAIGRTKMLDCFSQHVGFQYLEGAIGRRRGRT